MKIAHHFRKFLELNHYLVLPRVGKIETISTEVNAHSGEIEKTLIRFTSNPHLNIDNNFIEFISQKLNINSSIAISDLLCFCNSLNELLIQGFEAEIPGVGFLHMEGKNEMKFSGKSIYKAPVTKNKKTNSVLLNSSFWL